MSNSGARIIFPEKGVVSLVSFDIRPPERGEVTVRTRYSLMSIGTETTILHQKYDPGTHFARMFSFPQLQTGVQAIGTVERVGAEVTEFVRGDLIFMRKAHASHWTLAAADCSPVPPNIDAKSACWCGLAKTAFRAAHAAPFSLGGRTLIVGAGPVGQMAVRWASAAGMQELVVVDLSEFRLQLARRGGATHTITGTLDQVRQDLRNHATSAFEIVVEATGNPAVFGPLLGFAGMFGKVVLLGDTGYPGKQCLTSDLMTRGLTLVATHDHHDRGGWTQRKIDALFFELATTARFPLEGLITHEFKPDACVDAYRLASEARDQAVGVLFDWASD
jgi:2-desacetyl-2-hydroxyethyl bacteriochlorophyllide A dehydrogenase